MLPLFPEGALCIEIEGVLVGSMTGLLVDFNPEASESYMGKDYG